MATQHSLLENVQNWSDASSYDYWYQIFGPNPRIPTWLLIKREKDFNWKALSLWNPFSDQDLILFRSRIVWRYLATWFPFSMEQLTLFSPLLSESFSGQEKVGWKYYATENPHLSVNVIAAFPENMPWGDPAFLNRLSVSPPVQN